MFFIYKEFLLFLGELFYVLKFYKQSLYFYKKVYDEGFNKDECIEKILSCYSSLYDLDSVLSFSDEYLESGGENFNVYFFKGQALSYKGMYYEALKYMIWY
jgi:tetratricopeptide (TPR) repeat protein